MKPFLTICCFVLLAVVATTAQAVPEQEPNDFIFMAQNIDGAGWNLNYDPNIADSTTVHHVTIEGTGDGTFDYYSFTIANPYDTGIFDIDFGDTGGAGSMDAELFLYSLGGGLLAENDDASTSLGDGGSSIEYDPFIQYTFQAIGTYVIGVGEWDSVGDFGEITGNVPDIGDTYTLQVSLEGVPEPTTITLLLCGLMSLLCLRRRK